MPTEGLVTLSIPKGMPFPKLYYPGVPEREKATPITVRHGESIKNLRVVIKK